MIIRYFSELGKGKILIENVSKSQIGEDASSLIEAMLINAIQLAALYRVSREEEGCRPFICILMSVIPSLP